MNEVKVNKNILRQEITIADKKTQNLINTVMLLGSIGFLFSGFASYTNTTILTIFEGNKILFFPQGLTMTLYGIIGTLISLNQIVTYSFNVGEGYNEFNKENGKITIFRKGMPGSGNNIKLKYSLNDIVRE